MTFRSPVEFMGQILADYESGEMRYQAKQAVHNASDWKARLDAIRKLYEVHAPSIEDGIDPYGLELHDHFTPIEWRLWQDIRSAGLNFLPQFPVGPYVLDFADPKHKVGLEADGKEFHDAKRDKRRDETLFREYGWTVFRVTGAETFRVLQTPEDAEQDDVGYDYGKAGNAAFQFFMTTSEGVVRAVRDVICKPRETKWTPLMRATLDAHCLVQRGI